MIEKLEPLQGLDHSWLNKINKIIELLNAITIDVDGTKCVDGSKAPSDPYAEQRKWIGKLCKFWDDNEDEGYIYEILIDIIDDGSDYPYKIVETDCKNWTLSYKHCEPVSEDLIYKGGDNEL